VVFISAESCFDLTILDSIYGWAYVM